MSEHIAIVGTGRMGAGLGLALVQAGREVTLLSRTTHSAMNGVPVAAPLSAWGEPLSRTAVVLLATPDAVIRKVAETLAGSGHLRANQTVLHLSGLLDSSVLAPLKTVGVATGSLHPLMAVSDPVLAPQRLAGAYAAVEGEPTALVEGAMLARAIGMIPVEVPASAKRAYHAGATLSSNYTVTLFDAAVRAATAAGIDSTLASRMYFALLRGTVENLGSTDPAEALTGAIRRGDADTVRAHLAALSSEDLRTLYRAVGQATLALAERGGLATEAVERVRDALGSGG